MVKFVRTNSSKWNSVDHSNYKDSIVFIEDTEQIYSNEIYYGGKTDNGLFLEKIEFTEGNITIDPSKFYFCNESLSELDIILTGDSTKMNTYFVEFICDDSSIMLPSNIKWGNGIVPDFSKEALVTIKIQDDTAYVVDMRKLYTIYYESNNPIEIDFNSFNPKVIRISPNKIYFDSPVTEIKDEAFEGNDNITFISIPKSIKKIGYHSFSNCPNLEEILFEGTIENWYNIDIDDDWKEGTNVEVKDKNGYIIDLIDYLTFTAEEANSTIGLAKLSTNQTLEYSRDRSTWSNMDTSTSITLPNAGNKVYIRGMLSGNNSTSNYTQFKMTGKIAASGNCNTVWNYEDLNALLKEYCGYYMFRDCTSLTTTPELPATTLAKFCYYEMFNRCTSLTIAPELPTTTLVNNCYDSMFWGCSSLTTAPELPATTLADSCYNYMFYDCTSLNYIKCLATDISANDCTSHWVDGVSSTGTFVKHPDMNDWTTKNIVSGIPTGWTVENAEIS